MRAVTCSFVRTEYGSVTIEVPDNATDEEIEELAQEAESDGMVNWVNEDLEYGGIIDEEKI